MNDDQLDKNLNNRLDRFLRDNKTDVPSPSHQLGYQIWQSIEMSQPFFLRIYINNKNAFRLTLAGAVLATLLLTVSFFKNRSDPQTFDGSIDVAVIIDELLLDQDISGTNVSATNADFDVDTQQDSWLSLAEYAASDILE